MKEDIAKIKLAEEKIQNQQEEEEDDEMEGEEEEKKEENEESEDEEESEEKRKRRAEEKKKEREEELKKIQEIKEQIDLKDENLEKLVKSQKRCTKCMHPVQKYAEYMTSSQRAKANIQLSLEMDAELLKLKERERRLILRKIEAGEITWDKERK